MNGSRASRFALLVGVFLALTLLPACGDDGTSSPPTLHCGRDICAECGMIINEARFAAAITVDNDGIREHRLFDDVGDMFDYESSNAGTKILARHVQDYSGGGWLPADSARYVVSKEISTPMASGIVAFATAESAATALGESVRTVGIAEAREARAVYRRDRSGR